MSNLQNLSKIESAISTLRQYNQYALFSLSEEVFDNDDIFSSNNIKDNKTFLSWERYFDEPIGSPIEKTVEKIIGVAAANAVFDNPNIPNFNKERSAKNTARDVVEALRYAKLEFHAQTKCLPYKEYMAYKKRLGIVKRAAKIQMAKNIAKNLSITAFATTVGGAIGGSVTFASRLLWKLFPEKVKKAIKQGAKAVKEKALYVLEKGYNYIKNTRIAKKVQQIAEKVGRAVRATKKKIAAGTRKVVDCVKSFWPF